MPEYIMEYDIDENGKLINAKRKEEVWEAIINSRKSYEEILKMIRDEMTEED